jgi:tripartite-type tricarboxylate transporter receptor subunit TctC
VKRRAALAGAAWLALRPAAGQETDDTDVPWVQLVVPASAGGASYRLAHALALAWPTYAGQDMVALERPGGAGAIAVQTIARGPTNGSMLLLGNTGTHVVRPAIHRLPDLEKLVPVAKLASTAAVLTAPVSLQAVDIAEVLALARAAPGALAYGSTGQASLPHLVMEAICAQAGISLLHVPYKSIAASLADLVAGRLHLNMLNVGTALALLREGRVRPLAVSAASRLPSLPAVPTFREAGMRGVEIENWHGLFAHRSVPAVRLQSLVAAAASVVMDPDFRTALVREHLSVDSDPAPSGLEDLIRDGEAQVRRLISARDLKLR